MPSYQSVVRQPGNAVCIPTETERGSGEMWPMCGQKDTPCSGGSIFPAHEMKTADFGSVSFSESLPKILKPECVTGPETAALSPALWKWLLKPSCPDKFNSIQFSFIYIAPIHNTCCLKALHNSQVHTFQLIVTIEQCSQIQLFIQIG
ncbi:hypothetical protein XENOCAPTIV_013520 [Xenoophorus captivus]|uniref:Uncharacterized protein n=1 Tax=Xenoophorus captivus TaxID=1517983 RepID=A0ABV0S1C8_9TELE